MTSLGHLWTYLSTNPLLGLTATLLAYLAAEATSRATGHHPLANPVLLAIAMLAAILLITRTPYPAYFQGGQYVQFLLGPATVALAVPMYSNLSRIRAAWRAIVPALLVGSVVAAGTAMLIARLMGAERVVVLSLAPKSVTTPIAMGVAEQIGGQASLAAVFVLTTGLLVTVLIGPLLRGARVTDSRAIGLAGGTAGHGLATAHLLRIDETAAAFAGLAIGLNGLATALLVPLLARWIVG